jgi:hypothetical protein
MEGAIMAENYPKRKISPYLKAMRAPFYRNLKDPEQTISMCFYVRFCVYCERLFKAYECSGNCPYCEHRF